ncbi:RNA polymerase sigma factor [Paenibacillus tyrfis]|uniref:RNA polymerase sigma factor n=1 Tax=Paenibacillus tyrfis TaxID=1501230 RepID=A0A081P3B9_9BACL|nr:sigma-70 family RNA polymerase sigma factor [Paenibacillus tyrfis]KEQ25192.1 DNA-directed RNA polymerase subunit sigma [Paenibacillus tyrfis]
MQGLVSPGSSIRREGRGRTITEEAWIARIVSGDADAFRELVDKYGSYLFQAVYGVLRSTKDAEDVTQEALLKIYASLPQYRYQGLKTWLTRIAVNKAIDFKRSQDRKKEDLTDDWEGRTPPEPLQSSPVETQVIRRERSTYVRERLDRLPENYRDVVVAFYIEEKSYQQIAEEQQVAIKTVESKLYRAKQYMRKVWKEEEWE